MRLVEKWKSKLDKGYVIGAILKDLSKAFDCVPHDLLIAKLHAYGFEIEALKYIFSYLSDRQQSTRINAIYSLFQLIVSGVPQGSILEPISTYSLTIYFILYIRPWRYKKNRRTNSFKSIEIIRDVLTGGSIHKKFKISRVSKSLLLTTSF